MKTKEWNEVKHLTHDISGIENPEHWTFYEKYSIWYPYQKKQPHAIDNPPPFNGNTFTEVVKSNTDMFVQYMSRENLDKVVNTGNPLMTDQEVREMAVRFFRQRMAAYLAEHLER